MMQAKPAPLGGHPRILIAGYFGFGNTGDEAILAAELADLRARRPEAHFSVVGEDVGAVAHTYDVDAIHWRDLPAVVTAARESDLILLGGGGVFHEYWQNAPETVLTREAWDVPYYAGFPLLADLLGKPCMIYGVGVGPLLYESGRQLTRLAFSLAQRATLRDDESLALLKEIGVPAAALRVTADPAFTLPVDPAEGERLAASLAIPPATHLVTVSLRPWDVGADPAVWEAAVARALNRVAGEVPVFYAFIPFQEQEANALTRDSAPIERVRAALRAPERSAVLPAGLPPASIAALIARSQLTLGMRLHALVFAIQAAVPPVGLVYDPKVAHLMARVGLQDDAFELAGLDPDRLAEALLRGLRADDASRARLRAHAQELRALAGQNADLAVGLLDVPLPQRSPAERWPRELALQKVLQTDEARQNAGRLWQQLLDMQDTLHTAQHKLEETEAKAALLWQQLLDMQSTLQATQEELEITRQEREHTVSELGQVRAELEAVYASRSWKLTEGLRRVGGAFGPRSSGELAKARTPAEQGKPTAAKEETRPPASGEPSLPPASEMQTPVQAPQDQAARESAEAGQTPAAAEGVPLASASVHGVAEGGDGTVHLLVPFFFEPDGAEMRCGGTQRYIIELVRVLRGLGIEPLVYQAAEGAWEREYDDVHVRGIDTGGRLEGLGGAFHDQVPPGRLTLYLPFTLAAGAGNTLAVGLSFAGPWEQLQEHSEPQLQARALAEMLETIGGLTRLVTTDSATPGWLRAQRPELAGRLVAIPNFVDLARFSREAAPREKDGWLTVLYPRRLCTARGFWLVSAAVPALLESHPRLRFEFVGRADPQEEQAVRLLVEQYGPRVTWNWQRPELMPEVYAHSAITVLPGVSAGGPGLAALEALASGSVVLATPAGGLSELILSEFNGLLVAPEAAAVEQGLRRLIEDPALRKRLAAHGREVASSFSLQAWQARWTDLLRDVLGLAA